MSEPGHLITHVSDTARWTALYRATESARTDALFRDPLAERLAGEQGRAIVAKTPMTSRSGWWLVARTKIIDDAIFARAAFFDKGLHVAGSVGSAPQSTSSRQAAAVECDSAPDSAQ